MARQEVRFLIVGGFNTLMGLGFFVLLHLALPRIPYLVTLLLTYAIGIPLAFILQRRWVFKVSGNTLVDFFRFTSVQAAAVALNALVLPFLVEVVGLGVLIGQVVSLAIIVVGSYFAHLLISFRRPPG